MREKKGMLCLEWKNEERKDSIIRLVNLYQESR